MKTLLQNSLMLALCLAPGTAVLSQPVPAAPGASPLSGTGALTPAQQFQALAREVEKKIAEKSFPDALAQVERALAAPDQGPPERARLLTVAATAHLAMVPADIAGAIASYERIVADSRMPNSLKLVALEGIANTQIKALDGLFLHQMELESASRTLARGLELPDLSVADRLVAYRQQARLLERQEKFEDAIVVYDRVLALDLDPRGRTEMTRLKADSLARAGKVQEALALYREVKLDPLPIYTLVGDHPKRWAHLETILNDPSVPERDRWTAFGKLPIFDWRSPYLDRVLDVSTRYLPGFLKSDPNRVLVMKRFVVGPHADADFVAWVIPLMLQAPNLSVADNALYRELSVEGLAARGQTEALRRQARSALMDVRLAETSKLWLELVSAEPGGNPAQLSQLLAQYKTLSTSQKSEALLKGARTLLRAGEVEAAEALSRHQKSLVAPQNRATVVCRFVSRSPRDATAWITSSLSKDRAGRGRLDRPYGDNLKFLLETDSAVMGRNTSADTRADTGDAETDLLVSCDEEGVHIFLNAKDARVKEVMAGAVSGGSFEAYMAPGAAQPYHTFLINMPHNGSVDPSGFVTTYPNPNHRPLSVKEGNFVSQTVPTETGFATSLFLSWAAFYDKLPANGQAWQFEAIRWTRSGGLSFGGSRSVHNRSSWGDIVFEGLTPANLNAIKRRIVSQAAVRYRQAKGYTGPVGQWSDLDLGDLAFYKKEVEPLFATLDGYASQVSPQMTPAQVDLFFEKAVPSWLEIEFVVAELRRKYLMERVVAG